MVKRSRKYDISEREGRIVFKLYKMKKRLHKIEKELRDSNALSIDKTFYELPEDEFGAYRKDEGGRTLSIVRGLRHPDPEVRSAAAASAVITGTFSEIYFLILLLDDPVPSIRRQAWIAIQKITGIEFEFDPEEEETTRRAQIELLKNWWKEERINNL